MRPITCVLLLAGCSDYGLFGQREDRQNPDDTDPDVIVDDTDDPVETPEECNGIDDDGDGQVDEDFPDTDGDGTSDCLDDDCTVDVPGAGTVPVDSACELPTIVADPWDVDLELTWSGVSTASNVNDGITSPVIANLTDDDGDGDVDGDDVPDIVTIAFDTDPYAAGRLVVIDGGTGAEHLVLTGFAAAGGPAVADVDADGEIDIVAFDSTGKVVALAPDGTKLWTGPQVTGSLPQATVADLDGDGAPEVIAYNLVLDGLTGAQEATLPNGVGSVYTMAAVGDLDLDGTQEVAFGDTVYDPVYDVVEFSTDIMGFRGQFSAIVQADADPEGEVATMGGDTFAVFDDDGDPLARVTISGAFQHGPPCAADLDGDGETEIAWPSYEALLAYELDGTPMWKAAVDDTSGMAGCSTYDFDGNGAYEVVFGDQTSLWILDGLTGTPRYRDSRHSSATGFETPTVADVDADGSAEIVVVNNDYYFPGAKGITVYGHTAAAWHDPGPAWPIHDFASTNATADGTVPAATPYWASPGVYRGRPAAGPAVDLEVAFTGVCASGCADDSEVEVAVQVSNVGEAASATGLTLALYRDDAGTLTLLESVTLPSVDGGAKLEGVAFSLTRADFGDRLVVRVDDGDVEVECTEGNNEAEWTDLPC
jgi:hypothetical protein